MNDQIDDLTDGSPRIGFELGSDDADRLADDWLACPICRDTTGHAGDFPEDCNDE